MKIEVRVRLTETESYSEKVLASAEVAVEHVGDFDANALSGSLHDLADDVASRFRDQLRTIQRVKDREAREKDALVAERQEIGL